jgi:hypothetical protein
MAPKLLKTAKLVPMARVLATAELLALARRHWLLLEPDERRRLMTLVVATRGRSSNLTAGEKLELARLVAKADPRLFAGLVAQRFSPVPLPGRVVRGPRRRSP